MAVGFPTKSNWSAGDVLTASGMDDLAGTLNYLSPVGQANGSTLVANSANASGLGWNQNFAAGKNKIINGDFYVNQRNFSSSTISLAYTFDRFYHYWISGTATISAQTFTPGTAPVAGYEGKNYLRMPTATVGTGTSDSMQLFQGIEGVRTFAGQTVTVSFWAKSASGTPKLGITLDQNFGTSGSSNVYTSSTITLMGGTSWTRYTATLNVPSIAGKTIGTANDCLTLTLTLTAGATRDALFGTSVGIQSNTFDFWGVQLEAGSVATAFQTATGTLQGELQACQRYFLSLNNNVTATADYFNGGYYSTTGLYGVVNFPVQMRVAPSTSFTAGSTFQAWIGGSATTCSAIGQNITSPLSASLYVNTTAKTAGSAAWVSATGSVGTSAISFSAEL